ncbi:MAG: hypothetical protein V4695_01985 [Pseudomonadota bacterium]
MPNYLATRLVIPICTQSASALSNPLQVVDPDIPTLASNLLRRVKVIFLLLLVWVCAGNAATAAEALNSTALQAKYKDLSVQLKNNQFQRPIYLDSAESTKELAGNIYAVIDQPFASANRALNNPANWCDMLILHLNTKYCRAGGGDGSNSLQVSIGKKHDQPLDDAYPVAFKFTAVASTPDYMHVALHAKEGPMGTSDYRILLEAIPLAEGKTFLHLRYSYAYGIAARVAMKAYLSTAGSSKVGFTRLEGTRGDGSDGQYVGGVRGVVERNTMRYYLAIDAYLSALKLPASEQVEKRLQTWFDGTDRYARQLKEVERNDYLAMKRREIQRQQSQ